MQTATKVAIAVGCAVGWAVTSVVCVSLVRTSRTLRKERTEIQTQLDTTLRQLSATERQLAEARDVETVVKEVIVETRKDGTRTETKRESATVDKTKTERKETEVTDKREDTRRTTTQVVDVAPAEPARLGLNLGVALRWDDRLSLVPEALAVDVSYELGYRLAPRVGVEMPPTLGKPTSYTVGVEVRL